MQNFLLLLFFAVLCCEILVTNADKRSSIKLEYKLYHLPRRNATEIIIIGSHLNVNVFVSFLRN